ncbi:hypothetical protein B0T17DRAFT_534435 [Bombardia bombarda]|uniref:Uncharacterized protein n=1 Tax=Bombardia bombarda TaxID=252184 RepID=A0AA39WTY9_9PEZI|nr:hypothetical protein B0T17DRAFT_534435 [Bombardia bombarda]
MGRARAAPKRTAVTLIQRIFAVLTVSSSSGGLRFDFSSRRYYLCNITGHLGGRLGVIVDLITRMCFHCSCS